MSLPESVLKKTEEVYSHYGLDKETPMNQLQSGLLEVCYISASNKKSFIKCLDEGSKVVRKKVKELRKMFQSEGILNEPVTDEVVEKVIEELNTVKTNNGQGLGDIKRELVIACATRSRNVDDLLVCIDEGEKMSIILNKDLAKLL